MIKRRYDISYLPPLYMDTIDTMYAEDYYQLIHHPKVKPLIPNNHVPSDITTAGLELHNQQMLEVSGKGIYWGIYTHNRLIGTCGLHSWNAAQNTMEISYEIHPDFSGKGITTEAVKHAIHYADEHLSLKKILAYTLTDNIASQRVALKAGFIAHGILKNNCLYNGNMIDRMLLIYTNKQQ